MSLVWGMSKCLVPEIFHLLWRSAVKFSLIMTNAMPAMTSKLKNEAKNNVAVFTCAVI